MSYILKEQLNELIKNADTEEDKERFKALKVLASYHNTNQIRTSIDYYADGRYYDLTIDLIGCYGRMEEQKDIINEAYLRANSIDAVRGLAYRNKHTRESEELDRARTMILKLIDYIEKGKE